MSMLQAGLLPVDKPVGMRSTDCVQKLRRIFGRKTKIGHGGTLDSTASGLLFILVGGATRLSDLVMGLPKCYIAEVSFGTSTSTDDADGEVTGTAPWQHITEETVQSALCGFLGWRMQSPPAVSAVHIDGERAHSMARSGRAVVPEPRPVYFSRIEPLSGIDPDGRMSIKVWCSKGTYIRSVARDLGVSLGSAAHLSALRRVSCGAFTADKAKKAEELFDMDAETLASHLIVPESLCAEAASYEADDAQSAKLASGISVPISSLKRINLPPAPSAKIIVFSKDLFSVCTAARDGGGLKISPDVNIKYPGGNRI